MRPPELRAFLEDDEIIVDGFAGGGGASSGIERALGRGPDIAINHDPEAIAMHAANHPSTRHYCEDIYSVDPVEACGGRRVGLAWFSPDCTHHSKAKGGKPRDNKRRGLAGVVIEWARAVRPRIIIVENVEEFRKWGPLREDGTPDPAAAGVSYAEWRGDLEALDYVVEERELRACDFGAPTSRKRLIIVARRDGRRIGWPTPTHGPGRPLPWRTAAECIDWSIPCPSIFDRRRPLAEKTLRRIARGIRKFVLDATEPFIVPGGAAYMVHRSNGERPGQAPRVYDVTRPLGTVVAQGQKHALCMAFLAKHYGGHETPGAPMVKPFGTVTTIDHHALVTSHLVKFYGTSTGAPMDGPVPTVTAGGWKLGEVRAFLLKYYGADQDPRLELPLHTITTKHRFGLVTVHGEDYAIVDIGMRMLEPRELFRAQGFADDYVIDFEYDLPDSALLRRRGAQRPFTMAERRRRLSKTAQVRMCGNSVSPDMADAVVFENCRPAEAQELAA